MIKKENIEYFLFTSPLSLDSGEKNITLTLKPFPRAKARGY